MAVGCSERRVMGALPAVRTRRRAAAHPSITARRPLVSPAPAARDGGAHLEPAGRQLQLVAPRAGDGGVSAAWSCCCACGVNPLAHHHDPPPPPPPVGKPGWRLRPSE